MDSTSSLIDDSPPYTEAARAFHVANFVPVNWGAQDPISRSLVDFQFGREPQTTQWIRLACAGTEGVGPVDIILRALSSKEVASGGSASLDRLGSELALRTGAVYAPGRLTKTRLAAPVKYAGIREMRDRILRGAYAFDGAGLAETSRLLILDDIVTTGATFAAITAAIRESLPRADVRYFALGRTDPWLVRQHLGEDFSGDPDAYRNSLLGNAHLDPRYFFGAAAGAVKKPRISAAPPPPVPPPPAKLSGQPETSPAPPAADVAGDAVAETSSAPRPVVRAAPPAPARAVPMRRQSDIPWRAIAIALIAVGIVFVTFILTQSPQRETEQAAMPPPPATGAYDAVATKPPVQQPARPKPDTRPRGVINVPIVGLRLEPSITSGPVPDAIVRVGDKVIVVKTYRPAVGPDWYYVETMNRKYGWVIAPVITLATGRPAPR